MIDELAIPVTVPSVTVIVFVSAFFNVVFRTVVDCPEVKLTAVVYTGAVIPFNGPL